MAATVVFYVSGHGFGHAARQIEVINALRLERPDLRVVVRTSAAAWLFDVTLKEPAQLAHVEVDTGVVQIDSLRLDEAETITRAAAFHRRSAELLEREAAALESVGAQAVVGDIPPLAFAAAARRGVPALAVANFTWDWIYEGYPDALAGAPDLVPALQALYAQATSALRLPLGGGFASVRHVVDIPFIARRSRRDPLDTRRRLGLPADRPLVLVSFGGYGVRALDWTALAGLAPYGIVVTDDVTGRSAPRNCPGSTIFSLDERALYGSGLRYEDLVAACDVVATKPGYGIVAECIANGTAMLYTSRGRFVEYEVLVDGIRRWLRAAFISPGDLLAGRWRPHLDRLLAGPPPAGRPAVDGADVAAAHILRMLDSP